MRKGDILMIKAGGSRWNKLIGKVISLFTKSDYVHCAMYIGNKEIIEAGWKGVKILPCNTYGGENIVLRHVHANVYNKRLNEAVSWAKKQVGKKYDYLGLLGIAMAIINKGRTNPFDNKNRYWCSELVSDAYLNARLHISADSKTFKVSPGDLSRMPQFYEVKSKC